jgi:hypothetical protein
MDSPLHAPRQRSVKELRNRIENEGFFHPVMGFLVPELRMERRATLAARIGRDWVH